MSGLELLLLIVCLGAVSCASNTSIPRVSDGYVVPMKTAPWHAGLYTKTTNPYKQICGGTVIAKHVVVTAAHCITEDENMPSASLFAVAAGKIYRPWNDIQDLGAQKSDVKDIMIPPRYQGPIANFQDDIALLVLTKEFFYNVYVAPACLNFDANYDDMQLKEGERGKIVGWGLTGKNSPPSQVLQAANLPCVSISKCIQQSPVGFRSSITGDKICAGYNNGTAVCRGDSGGGLVFSEIIDGIERFFLRGIASTSPISEDECNIYTWATFTHLLRHEHFVKAVLPDVEESCGLLTDLTIVTKFGGSDRRGKNNKCPCKCPEYDDDSNQTDSFH